MGAKLGTDGAESSVMSHLIHALKHNKSSTIRKNAALILGKIGDSKAVSVLIQALEDRVASVRTNAAIALGMIGDKRAVKPLMSRLRSSSWQERLNAAVSLGWLADPHAAPPLLDLLYDNHAYVRRGAAFALGQIAPAEIKEMLTKLLTHRQNPAYEAAVVLGYMGDLSGYFYLLNLKPRQYKSQASERKRKTRNTALEGLDMGNLFYASSLYNEAAAEYRRALGANRKMAARTHFALLNNLGNALCAIGEVENGVVLYHLALRLKPEEKSVDFNVARGEIMSDIQELVVDQLKAWLSSQEGADIQLPAGVMQFFQSITRGTDKRQLRTFLRHFSLGWKSFYGLQSYQGEEIHSARTNVPSEFLESQVAQCQNALLPDLTFRHILVILLKLSQEVFPKPKEHHLTHHKMFTFGYFAALLQKIWHMSHLRFSLN